MMKLISIKEKQQKDAAASKQAVKQSVGELRLQKELADLSLPKNMSINFPDGVDKIMHFEITIKPEEGIYKDGSFIFDFSILDTYPYEAPKVLCKTKVFHPNIDREGRICLNILREDWKPVLSILSVFYGLQFLFSSPNPEDPLNKEAAQMMQDNARQFEMIVQRSIANGK